MFKVTKLITLKPDVTAEERREAADQMSRAVKAAPGVERVMLQPTLPGVFNGGDFIWHAQFGDEQACRAHTAGLEFPFAQAVESAAYAGGERGRHGQTGLEKGVYRTLLLSVLPGTDEAQVARFEWELLQMPHYIPAIRTWQLSRVAQASGTRKWTHVWEQEFADIGGLMGPYMMHPYHWGYIDRWFDPEHADRIVDTYLCHTFCEFDRAVI